jgi:hypothetical protein
LLRGYSNLRSLIIPVRPESNGYARKDDELSSSAVGVLAYWSVGKSQNPRFNWKESFHYSNTPAAFYMKKGL